MATQNKQKLNWLERNLAEGLIVDAAWLEARGYSRSLRSQYVSAGWLEQPARGVFRRPRGKLTWEQVVISLQIVLNLPVSLGGRTALDLQGYAHYVSGTQDSVHLYTETRLPGWLSKLPVDAQFAIHNRHRFLPPIEKYFDGVTLPDRDAASEQILSGALRVMYWNHVEWPLIMSTPERAILELLDELPHNETFHQLGVTMEGLVDLSPRRMQRLLQDATSIKVKRLFFFFADRHNHRWLKHISREKIDLGKGKRMIVNGGKFDSKYQITVPKEFIHAVS
ncbi:MAG: type IV toxin-antitoxin system AbiEi family antitoxin domain-containing protein [Gammaproteobacteria bacterium]|nr:type IV toxin-antitoxin system AbiEi family antitoxin domain-containing protein [Gammaproteobacteria bacterium]